MKKIFLLLVLVLFVSLSANANRYSTRYQSVRKGHKTEYQLKLEKRNSRSQKRYANFRPVTNKQVQKNRAKAQARIAKNTSLSRNSRGYQAQVAMRKR